MVSKSFAKSFEKQRRGHRPLRTCVGCREKEESRSLVSVHCILSPGNDKAELVFNARGKDGIKISGRGAWLHYDVSCFNKAMKRNALSIIFKAQQRKTKFLCPTLTDFEDTIMTEKAGGRRMRTR